MDEKKEEMVKRLNLVYWKMQNGHEHSFATEKTEWKEDDNIAGGYTFKDGGDVATQGDYFKYVQEHEHTGWETVEEFDYNEIDKFVERGYAYFANGEDDRAGIEFI